MTFYNFQLIPDHVLFLSMELALSSLVFRACYGIQAALLGDEDPMDDGIFKYLESAACQVVAHLSCRDGMLTSISLILSPL